MHDTLTYLILLVDDDRDYLFQLQTKVEAMGYKTITAESQREAEKLIGEIKPDLCILDLMMEHDDSGFVLAYKIKKKYPDVPVIIASAVTSETGLAFAEAPGDHAWVHANVILDKGIRRDQLENEIKKLLNP